MNSIRFTNLPVPEPLRHEVASIRSITYQGEKSFDINILPSGAPGILFQHKDGKSVIENICLKTGESTNSSTLLLYGPAVKPMVMRFKPGGYTTIQLTLKPQALNSIFGLNASILANQLIPLSEIAKGHSKDQHLEIDGAQRQTRFLTRLLANQCYQAEQIKKRDHLVEKGLQLIHQETASITVGSLIQTLHLSERQFERRFRETVGLSPKSYIRLRRFNRAVRLINSRQHSTLTEVAHKLHFHDQSHFIRDIRAFSGLTPKALAKKAEDFHCPQVVNPGQC